MVKAAQKVCYIKKKPKKGTTIKKTNYKLSTVNIFCF